MSTRRSVAQRCVRRCLVFALFAVTLSLSPLAIVGTAVADEALPPGCTDLPWDLSRELALFAAPGAPLSSGTTAESAPRIELARLYAVALVPQASATLPHPPGKPRLADGARVALLAFELPAAGRYRVTIDDGAWIDVVAGGELLTSNRFQGRSPCPLFHKSVEYTLPAGTQLVLQISGSTATVLRVAVTPVP